MPKKQLIFERGTGTALRSGNYTKAAIRAVEDALWHHSINVAEVFGADKSDMIIDVEIACQAPDQVDGQAVCAVFPYGHVQVRAVSGGLDIVNPHYTVDRKTIIAHTAIKVSLDLKHREVAE